MRRPDKPPDTEAIIQKAAAENPDLAFRVLRVRPTTPDGKYLHWDDLQFQQPVPEGLTHEQWWAGTDWARGQILRNLPLRGPARDRFRVAVTDEVQRKVHQIDRTTSGQLPVGDALENESLRRSFVIESLLEEAITSSQLEGAATTRRVAKEMIRTQRKPRDNDERMILNNYRAMEVIRERHDEPLTPELLLEIHRQLTQDTDVPREQVGRFRTKDVPGWGVYYEDDPVPVHVPPPASEIQQRIEELCRFANAPDGEGEFIHPVIRSILLHFWLAYDHPFVDGNGRSARALFYWSMLRRGYWLTSFLSISKLIKKAPAAYYRTFLFAETGTNDTTYFLLHQLDILLRAIDELRAWLTREVDELRETERELKVSGRFNHRQLAVLGHGLRHPEAEYSIEGHRQSHGVVYETARSDLLELEREEFLDRVKRGKTLYFRPRPAAVRKKKSRG